MLRCKIRFIISNIILKKKALVEGEVELLIERCSSYVYIKKCLLQDTDLRETVVTIRRIKLRTLVKSTRLPGTSLRVYVSWILVTGKYGNLESDNLCNNERIKFTWRGAG